MSNNVKSARRWVYLFMGSLTLLLGGIIYSWSILKSPLSEEFGWSTTSLALNYTIMMCMFFLGGFVSGLISGKVSANIRLFISGVLVFLGFFISSRLSADSIGFLYLAYGCMAGFGIGFLYNSSLSVIGGWFKDKGGLCSGVMLTCFGFSTLIFGGLAGNLINDPNVGWRTTFVILGSVMAAAVFVLAIFLREAPASLEHTGDDKKTDDDYDRDIKTAPAVKAEIPGAGNYTPLQMIKKVSFWKIFILFTLLSSTGTCAISFAKDFALFAGAPEVFAITVVGLLSVCNGAGRLFVGVLYDRIPLAKTQIVISVFAVMAPLCGIISIVSGIYFLEIVTLLLCGFSYGLCPTSTALYPRLFYGNENYSANFGIMNLHAMIGSFSATLAGAMIAATGSYLSVFIMLLCFSAAASALLLSLRKV